MKRIIVSILMTVGFLALVATGCINTTSNNTPVPPLNPSVQGRMVEVSYDELLGKKNISQEIELTYPQSLVVSLANNPSTGYQWTENATISDTAVLSQYEHNIVAAQNAFPGASGKDVWTFKPLKTGTSTVSMTYSQPWEGGTKNGWTFTLKVTVK